MARWIGVVAFGNFRDGALKRAALLFDTLAATRVDSNGRATMIEELSQAGIVGIRVPLAATLTLAVEGTDYKKDINVDDAELAELLGTRLLDKYRQAQEFRMSGPSTDEIGRSVSAEVVRLVKTRFPQDVVIPLLPRFREPADGVFAPVLSVVLQEMPMPDRSTPWEAIRDFRDDEDARNKLRRLRLFVSRLGREGVPSHEIADQLASMAADYQTYTKLQHAQIRRGFWQILVVTAAGVLEDFATFRFAGAAERLLDLHTANLRIAEQELAAPGREVAYLTAVRERFGR